MLEFIVKYWIEFVLGLISGALIFACKKFYKLYEKEKNHQKTKEQKEFYSSLEKLIKEGSEESREGDKQLQERINIVQNGILSIQGRSFKEECRDYLREDHNVTLEEFELLQKEYYIYKSLGGNHDGDLLFNMVREKVTNVLTDVK